jgi:hypothetical protein
VAVKIHTGFRGREIAICAISKWQEQTRSLSEIRAGATFRDSTQHREGVQEHNK